MDSASKHEASEQLSQWLGSGSLNLFGLPFSGKDTQGKRLAELFDAPLLGGGDILRGSVIPKHVKAAMQTGQLIPTKDYLEIVLPYLSQEKFKNRPLILSAVGRWHGEEDGVMAAAEASNHPLKAVIYLRMSETELWQRWEAAAATGDRGSRVDDDAEAIQTRLSEFNNKTVPALDYYRQRNLLIEVNGTAAPNDVTAEILASLSQLLVN